MRKLAIGLLALFRRAALALRRMRGTTEDDLAARRVVSGQAWDEFCDTLKAAGASLNFPARHGTRSTRRRATATSRA